MMIVYFLAHALRLGDLVLFWDVDLFMYVSFAGTLEGKPSMWSLCCINFISCAVSFGCIFVMYSFLLHLCGC